MAHYAFLNDSNIVTEVIIGIDENELIDGETPEDYYGKFRGQRCIRTSYNGKIRYNYAGIGHSYDPIDDAFIPPMLTCGHDEITLTSQKIWDCSNPVHKEGQIGES
jgi:hypothetical protein